MKTPEELAEEFAELFAGERRKTIARKSWWTGYQAAQEHAHAALEEAKARMEEIKDQVAGVSKVMPDTCEHILDMEKMVDVNGWISVDERLPELGQKVLVWYDNGYEVAYLQKFEPPKLQYPQFNNVEMFEWCFGDFEDFDVTHWMPLPKPPEE
jgi:hypothetical protein